MKQTKKKKRTNRLKIILIYGISICCIYTIAPNYQKIEQNTFSILYNNTDRTCELKYPVKIEQKEVYFALEDLQTIFGQDVYIDETGEWIVTTSETKVAAISTTQPVIKINSVSLPTEHLLIHEGDRIYIPISILEKVYHADIQYIETTNRVLVDLKSRELISADAKNKIAVKKEKKPFTATIETIKKGDSLIWISNENGSWCKIRTQNGNIGYVKQKKLTNFYTIRENMPSDFLEEQAGETITNLKNLTKIKRIKIQDIQSYQAREQKIEAIVDQCVANQVSCLEINDETLEKQDKISYNRFQKELEVRLHEVGVKLK